MTKNNSAANKWICNLLTGKATFFFFLHNIWLYSEAVCSYMHITRCTATDYSIQKNEVTPAHLLQIFHFKRLIFTDLPEVLKKRYLFFLNA